jgi:hypothetical protein
LEVIMLLPFSLTATLSRTFMQRLWTGVLAVPACAMMASAPASAQTSAQAPAASKIAPPAGAKALMTLPAIGVQIYKCTVVEGRANWTFVAPEADLFDSTGKLVGRHGAGPFWEWTDGSKVNGMVAARMDAPRPGAIPHLLLNATSTGKAGVLEKVKFIQRVNTLGGAMPPACTSADLDKVARIYYTADYVLYTD